MIWVFAFVVCYLLFSVIFPTMGTQISKI